MLPQDSQQNSEQHSQSPLHPYTLHDGQQTVYDSTHRFRVVACGRRWGKTALGIQTVLDMLGKPNKAVWWVAPTYSLSTQVWFTLQDELRGKWQFKREADRLIQMSGNTILRVRSAVNPNALRGSGLDLCVLDEAAFLPEMVWTHVIRPSLADRQGKALFLSSPYGLNWFYRLYARGQDPAFAAEWASWRFTSAEGGRIKPEEMASTRLEMPERVFRQEYLAEFLDDSGGVFRNVRERAIGVQHVTPPSGARIIFGIDFGRAGDYTAIAVLNASTMTLLHMERFRDVDWTLQRGRIMAANTQWKPTQIWAETNSMGEPNIEELEKEGLPMHRFTTTAASKAPLIDALALAFETPVTPITIYHDELLLGELGTYQMIRAPGGGYKYSAPPGQHDDMVIALAIALHGARFGGDITRWAQI